MSKSILETSNTRFAPMVRFNLTRRSTVVTALALLLAMGSSLFAGASLAQEQQATTAPTTVNINSADAETLAAVLQGVGQSRAREIVRYRESYGPFSAIDELADVKGIGQSTLEQNKQVITLE